MVESVVEEAVEVAVKRPVEEAVERALARRPSRLALIPSPPARTRQNACQGQRALQAYPRLVPAETRAWPRAGGRTNPADLTTVLSRPRAWVKMDSRRNGRPSKQIDKAQAPVACLVAPHDHSRCIVVPAGTVVVVSGHGREA